MIQEIVPNLYLGAWGDIQNIAPFDVFIVNCTCDLPLHHRGFCVDINDHGKEEDEKKLMKLLPLAVQAIDNALNDGMKVYVHCLAGQQRSPTVVAAYLMWKHGMPHMDAVGFIKDKRKEAFFGSINFITTLQVWQQTLSDTQTNISS